MDTTPTRRTDPPAHDPAPRRDPAARAQTEAGGVAAPLTPSADAPSRNARTADDATTSLDANDAARRSVVLAILRTLAPAELAAVVAALVTWLHALDAAVRIARQSEGAKRTARAMANASAEALMESEAMSFVTEPAVIALSGVWFGGGPYAAAEHLLTHDARAAAVALEDLSGAELLTRAAPVPLPSTGRAGPRDVREVLRDVAAMVTNDRGGDSIATAYDVCAALAAEGSAAPVHPVQYFDALARDLSLWAVRRIDARSGAEPLDLATTRAVLRLAVESLDVFARHVDEATRSAA